MVRLKVIWNGYVFTKLQFKQQFTKCVQYCPLVLTSEARGRYQIKIYDMLPDNEA